MIEFSEKDFQMKPLRRESKLFNLQTKQPFRVYGLQKKGNPLIHLSYNYDTMDEDFEDNLGILIEFFENNGIEFRHEGGSGTPKVCIGLRWDLRDRLLLCSSILQTIVYCLEGRLALNADYKVKGLPKCWM